MTRDQERAAVLSARGLTYREIAAAVGVSLRTVEQWFSPTKGVPGLRDRVEAERALVLEPGALDVCRQALSATRKDGTPDWTARLTAARLLMLAPDPDSEAGKANGRPEVPTHVTLNVWRDPLPVPDPPESLQEDVIEGEATEVEPAELPRATGPSFGIPDAVGRARRPKDAE